MPAAAKRQKTRIEEIRRIELIEAAHRIFLRDGLKGLTTTRICHEAGMSQGILSYYFKDKEHILFEMVRYANRSLMDNVVIGLRAATTPWGRLVAIVNGNFPADRFEQNIANAWISFYAETAHNSRYARLQALFYRRLHSNIASLFPATVSRSEVDHFVRGFAAMLDGLWLRRGHSATDIDLPQATSLLIDYAEKMLGVELTAQLKLPVGRGA